MWNLCVNQQTIRLANAEVATLNMKLRGCHSESLQGLEEDFEEDTSEFDYS